MRFSTIKVNSLSLVRVLMHVARVINGEQRECVLLQMSLCSCIMDSTLLSFIIILKNIQNKAKKFKTHAIRILSIVSCSQLFYILLHKNEHEKHKRGEQKLMDYLSFMP
jgi:hypothetical protein